MQTIIQKLIKCTGILWNFWLRIKVAVVLTCILLPAHIYERRALKLERVTFAEEDIRASRSIENNIAVHLASHPLNRLDWGNVTGTRMVEDAFVGRSLVARRTEASQISRIRFGTAADRSIVNGVKHVRGFPSLPPSPSLSRAQRLLF